MVWTLLLALLALVILMSLYGAKEVPWARKLYRIHAGVAGKAEWMAPHEVVEQVRADYLAALHWLYGSSLNSWAAQWSGAAAFLAGDCLRRQQRLLTHIRRAGTPHFACVLRADHQVEVRHFSEGGERCLVIDRQMQRRMATYHCATGKRVSTQDLGSGSVVYQMHYDIQAKRWKIEAFIQELPLGWGNSRLSQCIDLLAALPTALGRDH